MSTTVTTYLARYLIDLGSLLGDLIGLALFPGRAPVLIVDWPGGSAEIGCPPALAAVLLSARNSVRGRPAGGDGGHPARAVLGR
jgi:hypothetical protein